MNAEPSPVQPGDIVAGKYRVDRVLGMGGMGVVVAATHLELREVRALKFLLPSALANSDTVERFRREARAALRLKSEHVARVLDIGKLDNGAPYMVMEYLDGHDLSASIKEHGAVPLERAVLYVLQAMDGIAEAHARGIVHRDLKPSNLFLTKATSGMPCVKVLDFGISKIALEPGQGGDMTKTHTVLGSPQYMSPEQMQSTRDVDHRADIWSLGVILYQLTTGKLPFRGRNVGQIMQAVFCSRPDAPSRLSPQLPPAFDEIVMRCLRLDPADRYATVAELAAALAPFGPPQASFMRERIARYGTTDASKMGPTSSPGLTSEPYVASEWDTPVGATPNPSMTNSLSSAPTRVMHVAAGPRAAASAPLEDPTNVMHTPSPASAESARAIDKTEVMATAPKREARMPTSTEVMALPSATPAPAPIEASIDPLSASQSQTASTQRSAASRTSYVIGAVILAVLALVVVGVLVLATQ